MQSLEQALCARAAVKKRVPHDPGPGSYPGPLPETERCGDAAGALRVQEEPTDQAPGHKRLPP